MRAGSITVPTTSEPGKLFLRPPTLTASNFEALNFTDLIFEVSKDLNLLKKHTKNQEASYNFRLGLALSNRPHFNSALY